MGTHIQRELRVGFCTTCKGRAQHIKETLPANLRDNKKAHIALVNYNSQDDLDEFIQAHHMGDIESGRLAVYRFTEPGPFRMAHAKNLAHRLAMLGGADVLVNIDADNFAGKDFDQYAVQELSHGDDFLWSLMKKGEMHRGISGRIAVTAKAFLLVGGYDEFYSEWGPDDKDFKVRLRRVGFTGRQIADSFLDAINHNDKMRFREYPHINREDRVYDFQAINAEPCPRGRIANMRTGFGCGVVYKNFSREPLEIPQLPTRIFGIGMHKTATTSLSKALAILGFDSAHWTDAHWARAVWEEMKTAGKSKTVERNYAMCDLPFPLLFRELDKAYPGSKFILTTRDEDSWLESVRTHWSDKNPFRHQWDTDPFTHRVHRELYGGIKFNEPVMRERFRRHNAEVLEYFKDRPRDLLVFDLSKGAGWHELCGFLRKPLVDVPYPRENKYG